MVTTFDVAVREVEELSVYVADAWLPMDVPATVCAEAVPEAMHSSVKNKTTIRAEKTALPEPRFLPDMSVSSSLS